MNPNFSVLVLTFAQFFPPLPRYAARRELSPLPPGFGIKLPKKRFLHCCLPISRFALNTAGGCAIACGNARNLPRYVLGLAALRAYARPGAAMFSLRCEHTPRFFQYFAQQPPAYCALRIAHCSLLTAVGCR